MNTQYTPGPWHCEIHSPAILIVHEQLGDPRLRTYVAQLDTSTETEANARLIAAAPELADALRWMLSAMWQHFEYHHDGDDDCGSEPCQMALDAARAALAKLNPPTP